MNARIAYLRTKVNKKTDEAEVLQRITKQDYKTIQKEEIFRKSHFLNCGFKRLITSVSGWGGVGAGAVLKCRRERGVK